MQTKRNGWPIALALVGAAGALTVAPACRAPTEIMVTLTTNVDCAGIAAPTFRGGHVALIANGAPIAGSEATIDTRSCIKGELGSIAIVPGESGADATVRIRAVALLGGVVGSKITEAKQCLDKPGSPECIVASRSLKFVTHQSLSIPIFLDSACAGVSCPEGKTCGAGGACIGDDVVVVDAGTAVDAGTKPLVATSLFAGGDRTCAETKSGFYCWGAGFGATPVRVAELDGSVSVALGKNHYCALHEEGALTCFGSNAQGQLGTSTLLATKNEVAVPEYVDSWREVSVGAEHTCALGDSSKLGKVVAACWGGQSEGQVDGVVTKVIALPRVIDTGDLAFAGTIEHLTSTSTTNCVNAAPDGNPPTCVSGLGGCYDLVCWGSNALSQCGRPNGDPSTTPRFLKYQVVSSDLSTPIILVGGANHVAALSNGGAFGWGDSSSGQLADVTDGGANIVGRAASVAALTQKVSVIAAGDRYTCGIVSGVVVCRGAVPFKGGGFADPVALAGGANHVCILDTAGHVFCGGQNSSGQLGNPQGNDSIVEVLGGDGGQ